MPQPEEQQKRPWGRHLAASMLPKNTMLREALLALVLAVMLEGIVILVKATPWWETTTLADQDYLMRAFSGEIIRRETAQPLAFIDIDDAALAAWGNPMITPRSYLLRLINALRQAAQRS